MKGRVWTRKGREQVKKKDEVQDDKGEDRNCEQDVMRDEVEIEGEKKDEDKERNEDEEEDEQIEMMALRKTRTRMGIKCVIQSAQSTGWQTKSDTCEYIHERKFGMFSCVTNQQSQSITRVGKLLCCSELSVRWYRKNNNDTKNYSSGVVQRLPVCALSWYKYTQKTVSSGSVDCCTIQIRLYVRIKNFHSENKEVI